MKRKIFISILLVMVIMVVGCDKKNDNLEQNVKEEKVTKIESQKDGVDEKVNILLNGKEHHLSLIERKNHQVSVIFDNQEFLSFEREHYDGDFSSDTVVYKTVKGQDNQNYFVFAMSNFYLSSFQQYLYIFNDLGNVIYHDDDSEFGAAFTDYEHIESFEEMYGDTGKYKIGEDNITYLKFFNYTPPEDFSRYQEMIMTINNNEIKTEQGNIIKVAMVS